MFTRFQLLPRVHVQMMEHYTKKQSYYIDEKCKENEIRVTSSGKPHDIASKVLHIMKEHPVEGAIVSGSGCHVTKTVTVAELLKKRQKGLKQQTEIKYIRVEDVWEPDQPDLDQLKVTRNIPAISIKLTLDEREDRGKESKEKT